MKEEGWEKGEERKKTKIVSALFRGEKKKRKIIQFRSIVSRGKETTSERAVENRKLIALKK